jgi:hypothetical protein
MREHISCVTINSSVMGISVHSGRYPYFAPACEYVRMPPESLSTLAVMSPGPMTEKKIAI